jgi:hypothetical protein
LIGRKHRPDRSAIIRTHHPPSHLLIYLSDLRHPFAVLAGRRRQDHNFGVLGAANWRRAFFRDALRRRREV